MNQSVTSLVSKDDVATFQRDGAICLRGAFKDWIEPIAEGIARNQREPGPYATNVVTTGEPGGFFDDYCNWERIPEFAAVVRESPAAGIAAAVMQSASAQFFHDHVLVKEPGTQKPTPGIRTSLIIFSMANRPSVCGSQLTPCARQPCA